ncbi:hypothetical protein [Virgibacillus doumboii]|uniref:hypothetical protein n=1 Tax=Virgibacillus doumboii TaxID=2697503 RepID=UPI0013DE8381|nr:hypothetical protein [Virgibacillus doumboii]
MEEALCLNRSLMWNKILIGGANISDFIPTDEHKSFKNKLLIRNFVIAPVTISFAVYLYSSLLLGELVNLNVLLYMAAATLIIVSIVWISTNTDNEIKKEEQREFKKNNKSKKRIAVEYVLIILLFIVFVAYAWQY